MLHRPSNDGRSVVGSGLSDRCRAASAKCHAALLPAHYLHADRLHGAQRRFGRRPSVGIAARQKGFLWSSPRLPRHRAAGLQRIPRSGRLATISQGGSCGVVPASMVAAWGRSDQQGFMQSCPRLTCRRLLARTPSSPPLLPMSAARRRLTLRAAAKNAPATMRNNPCCSMVATLASWPTLPLSRRLQRRLIRTVCGAFFDCIAPAITLCSEVLRPRNRKTLGPAVKPAAYSISRLTCRAGCE